MRVIDITPETIQATLKVKILSFEFVKSDRLLPSDTALLVGDSSGLVHLLLAEPKQLEEFKALELEFNSSKVKSEAGSDSPLKAKVPLSESNNSPIFRISNVRTEMTNSGYIRVISDPFLIELAEVSAMDAECVGKTANVSLVEYQQVFGF